MALQPGNLVGAITRAGENEKRRKFLAFQQLAGTLGDIRQGFNRDRERGEGREFQDEQRIAGQDFRTKLEAGRRKHTLGRDEQAALIREGELSDAAKESKRRFDITQQGKSFNALSKTVGGFFTGVRDTIEGQQTQSRLRKKDADTLKGKAADRALKKRRLDLSESQYATSREDGMRRARDDQLRRAQEQVRQGGTDQEKQGFSVIKFRTGVLNKDIDSRISRIKALEKRRMINPEETDAKIAEIQSEIDALTLEREDVLSKLPAIRVRSVTQPNITPDPFSPNNLLEDRRQQNSGG